MWLYSLIVIWMYSIKLANLSIIRDQDPSDLEYNSDGLECYTCKGNLSDHQNHQIGIQATTHTSAGGENDEIIDGIDYFSPEKNIYEVSYVAHGNGYRSRGQRSAGDVGVEPSIRPKAVTKPPATETTTDADWIPDDYYQINADLPDINQAALESISGNRG